MSALTQFLWEDYLINSDVGEAAKAKAQIEEAEHQKLLKLNEETNKQVRWTHSTPFTVSFSSKQSFPKGWLLSGSPNSDRVSEVARIYFEANPVDFPHPT